MEQNFWRDPQNIIAVGVTFLSVCALVVSIQQTRIMQEQRELMHEQAKAAVWPRLAIGINKGHKPGDGSIANLELTVTNEGVGPAIVKAVEVRYQDSIVSDWWDLFAYFDLPDSVETYVYNANLNQSILRAGENLTMLNLDDNLPLAQHFFEHLDGLELVIWYESIYGDCWRLDILNEGIETVEVADPKFPAAAQQFDG